MATTLATLMGATTSCSHTQTKSFTMEPGETSNPVTSVVTLMVDDRPYIRAALENNLTGQLKKRNVEAHSTYNRLRLKDIPEDKEQARQALSAWGTQAALVCRLTDRTDIASTPEIAGNASHWEEVWSDPAITRSRLEGNRRGSEVTVTVHLESKLYRLSDAELLWAGYTETKLKEFTDDLKRIEAVASQLVGQLKRDGQIP
jgi:hypothetical protein